MVGSTRVSALEVTRLMTSPVTSPDGQCDRVESRKLGVNLILTACVLLD